MRIRIIALAAAFMTVAGAGFAVSASAAPAKPAQPIDQKICLAEQNPCWYAGTSPSRIYDETTGHLTHWQYINADPDNFQLQQEGTNLCVTWNSAGYFDEITCADKASQQIRIDGGGTGDKLENVYTGTCIQDEGSNPLGLKSCTSSTVSEWSYLG